MTSHAVEIQKIKGSLADDLICDIGVTDADVSGFRTVHPGASLSRCARPCESRIPSTGSAALLRACDRELAQIALMVECVSRAAVVS